MNLEDILKNLVSSTDPKNVTAAVLDLITKLGREIRKRPSSPASVSSIENAEIIPHQKSSASVGREEDDDPLVLLAHNLSNILSSHFQNNTDLLEMLTSDLRDEEKRWIEDANRRLSDVTFSIIITIYVKKSFPF